MSSELPVTLTKEIKDQIATLIANGLTMENNREEIAAELGIPLAHLKQLFMQERQELLLRKAELTSKEILEIDLDQPNLEAKFGSAKIKLLKIKQAEASDIRESLGKDFGYSKRTELTGAGGGAIAVKAVVFNAPIMPNRPKPIDAENSNAS